MNRATAVYITSNNNARIKPPTKNPAFVALLDGGGRDPYFGRFESDRDIMNYLMDSLPTQLEHIGDLTQGVTCAAGFAN